MTPPIDSSLSELRQALNALRVTYHQALASKFGREIPKEYEWRRLISDETDEVRVIFLMTERRRSFLNWTGISRV
jgi:hypothetical protein